MGSRRLSTEKAGERKPSRTNVTIDDLMVSPVRTTTRHQTLGHVRKAMAEHGFHAMPVVDSEGGVVGIVTQADLLGDHKDGSRVSSVMSRDVKTVPRYDQPHVAARVMRNHGFHHVVVTHEKAVVGILSTFDLLRLVEEHRYVSKPAPTKKTRTKSAKPKTKPKTKTKTKTRTKKATTAKEGT